MSIPAGCIPDATLREVEAIAEWLAQGGLELQVRQLFDLQLAERLAQDALSEQLAQAAAVLPPRWCPEEPPLKPAPPDRESEEARAARRQPQLNSLLEKEEITINEWERRAKVGKNTARKYFDGATVSSCPDIRKKLAQALRVKDAELPD